MVVWQPLEIPLQYLQIDALRKRVASGILAETRGRREPDRPSGALTRARLPNEHQSEASVYRTRVSAGEAVNRVCSRVTHVRP